VAVWQADTGFARQGLTGVLDEVLLAYLAERRLGVDVGCRLCVLAWPPETPPT
jgi:hypothetical protein